jgi:hypothetical protein
LEFQMVMAEKKWTLWQRQNAHFGHRVITPMPFGHSLVA